MVEQRRCKRFELQLPIRVTRNGSRPQCLSGVTRNLSSGGVLFVSEASIEAGVPIEYTIELQPTETVQNVAIRCLGKVTRSRASDGEPDFEVAATLERYEFVRL